MRRKYRIYYPNEEIKIFLPEKQCDIQKYGQRQRKTTGS
jgi:hypothetical protein